MMAIIRIPLEIHTFAPHEGILLSRGDSGRPREALVCPTGDSRTSMIRKASLLLRRIIMVEREFGGGVGSNKCMAVGCFKHDVLMIQPSDHHKNLVGRDDFVSVGSCLYLEW